MSEKRPPSPTPDLLVEKLALSELGAAEAAAVRDRLAKEEGGLDRLTEIERSNRELLEAHPAERMTRDIEDRVGVARAREDGQRRAPAWWMGLPAAAAAALVLFVVLPSESERPSQEIEVTRTKGIEPRLRVFLDDDGGGRPLRAGDVVSAGDRLQLAYVAAGQSHGVVVSIDGRGEVTQHLPVRGKRAAQLATGGLVRLPHAYELDDAPAFERFFFVSAAEPFEVDVVMSAARVLASLGPAAREAALAVPEELLQVSFLVDKDGGGERR